MISLDKQRHIMASAIVALILALMFSFKASTTITSFVGLTKEVMDLMGFGVAEIDDLIADLIGIVIGISIAYMIIKFIEVLNIKR